MSARRSIRAAFGAALLLFAVTGQAVAQAGRVTGVATDQNTGQPLGGVQVVVKGTKLGSITSEDGRYTIANVPEGTHTIEAMRIGYLPGKKDGVQVSAAGVKVDFQLSATAIRLQETVVTGVVDATAGTKLPYSIGKVSKEDIPVPTGAASALVQAKVAGVAIVSGGQPGSGSSVQLRSPTAIQKSTGPMYVVDGVILNSDIGGTTTDLDALDIESVEIVKGAAAASLYGSRAANGVISITTNRGKNLAEGKTQVTFRSEYGANQMPRTISLNDHHWYRLTGDGANFADAAGNPVRASNARAVVPTRISDQPYPGQVYDNFKAFFNPGQFMTNSVAIAQNTGKTNFLASFNNYRESGVLRTNSGYRRNQGRINLDHRMTDAFSFSVSGMHSRAFTKELSGSPFQDILYYPPDVDLGAKDSTGNYIAFPDPTVSTNNPIWRQTSRDNYTERVRTLGSGTLRFQPFNWFSLSGDLSYDRSDINSQTYVPKGVPTSATGESTGEFDRDAEFADAFNGSVTARAFKGFFDRLNTSLTLRGIMERQKDIYFSAVGTNLLLKDLPRMNVVQNQNMTSSQTETRNSGYLLQTSLDLDDKYNLDLRLRRDGSSRFGPERKWHTYYGVAGSWRVAAENWWPFAAFDEFKLRGAVGTAGGQPAFSDQYETFSVTRTSVSRSTLGNPQLMPSLTRETELGVDFIVKRVSVELSYVKSVSKDQILQIPQPAASGFRNRWENAGVIEGNTWEATVRADVFRGKNVNWQMTLVADRSRSKITDWNRTCWTGTLTLYCLNSDRGDIWGYRFLKNPNELPAVHASSKDQFQVNDDGYLVAVGPGNSWRDGLAKGLWGTTVVIDGITYQWGLPFTQKDDKVASDTLVRIGSQMPNVHIGYANHVRFKGFTVYGLLDWVVGGQVYDQTRQRLFQQSRAGEVDQFGKPDETKKPIDYYTRLYYSNNNVDPFVEPGGYLKLRELSVKYTIPQTVMQSVGFTRIGAERVSLAVIGRNLFTVSKYKGYDPETGSVFSRYDNFNYPNYRTFTGNIEIVF